EGRWGGDRAAAGGAYRRAGWRCGCHRGARHDRQSACLDPAAPTSPATAHHYCRLPAWRIDCGGTAAGASIVEAGTCAPGIGVRVIQEGLSVCRNPPAAPAYHVELAAYSRARRVVGGEG